MQDKEEAKCKEEEEKQDRKRMRQAKAKEKKRQEQAKCEKREMTRIEKAKVAAIKAIATPHPKRNIRQPSHLLSVSESESLSDNEMSVYSSDESSEEGNLYEGSSNSCYECWKVFKGKEK